MKITERNLLDILLTILLFIAIGVCVKSCITYKKELSKHLTIDDLYLLQEMKDYHKSQDREIKVFE